MVSDNFLGCVAWTYVEAVDQCWLKGAVPPQVTNNLSLHNVRIDCRQTQVPGQEGLVSGVIVGRKPIDGNVRSKRPGAGAGAGAVAGAAPPGVPKAARRPGGGGEATPAVPCCPVGLPALVPLSPPAASASGSPRREDATGSGAASPGEDPILAAPLWANTEAGSWAEAFPVRVL